MFAPLFSGIPQLSCCSLSGTLSHIVDRAHRKWFGVTFGGHYWQPASLDATISTESPRAPVMYEYWYQVQ